VKSPITAAQVTAIVPSAAAAGLASVTAAGAPDGALFSADRKCKHKVPLS
jgi:hypothetical protein